MSPSDQERKNIENQEFKVNDRRRFGPDGTPREEAEEAPSASDSPASGGSPPEAKESPGADFDSEASLPADFSSLILSLAASAQSALGIAPHPLSGKVEQNLLQAKHAIDLLGVLAEKTKGNLTKEEDQLVNALLYDLRLRFVETKKESKK